MNFHSKTARQASDAGQTKRLPPVSTPRMARTRSQAAVKRQKPGCAIQISECRSCGSADLELVLDLGIHPIANALRKSRHSNGAEARYPLELVFCQCCTLLQISTTVDAETLFKYDYPYFSSQNPSLIAHGKAHAQELISERLLDGTNLVIEVASNDGYLLQHLVERGIPVLGIDPADGPAQCARAIGVPTVCDFFSEKLALRLVANGMQADVVIASNVVAHVDEINDFLAGFAAILRPGGMAIFECAYAIDMVAKCEFDTIYHEHLFYHSLHSLKRLVERHGLVMVDAERLAIHGGSLRIRVARSGVQTPRLKELWANEVQLGVDRSEFYRDFAARVQKLGDDLRKLLRQLRAEGKRIACYGAAAKGATMLNYLDLGDDFFDFVVDRSIHKQGKFMPGQPIPIQPPEALSADAPDYLLVLAWNFASDIIRENEAFAAAGGRFIVPVPEPHIV
jgi:SAM-dependent methyltransferase